MSSSRGSPRHRRCPRMAAPRIFRVSASATTFMKPSVSPFSMARPTRAHGPLADQQRPAGRARLVHGHPHAAERRIDVERIAGYAIADATMLAVEQVGGDDLEVVVRGVREGAAAVAVAERPDAGNVGRKGVVDRDVAARVGRRRRRGRGRDRRCSDAGPRPAARATRRSSARPRRSQRRPRRRARAARRLMHSAPVRTLNALAHEDVLDRLRHVFVLAADQTRRLLDDGHRRAEPPIHLRELEADVAAARR